MIICVNFLLCSLAYFSTFLIRSLILLHFSLQEDVQQISQEFINKLNNICYEKIAEQVRSAPSVSTDSSLQMKNLILSAIVYLSQIVLFPD